MACSALSRPVPRPIPLWQQPRDRQVDHHCLCEAHLEVESWFTGESYEWCSFDRTKHISRPSMYGGFIPTSSPRIEPLPFVYVKE